MTSFIAAGGSGRSTSVIPAVPAASSVTTIAFIRDLPVAGPCMPPADGRSRPPSAPRHRHWRFSTPPSLSRQPHMPAILSDLGRGGDVEWLAQYLARWRTMDMGLDDRPELDRRAADAIIAWNSRDRR